MLVSADCGVPRRPWAARINNSKAAGPVARVLRDAMLPAILKSTANSKAHRQTYDYHIDWDVPGPRDGLTLSAGGGGRS